LGVHGERWVAMEHWQERYITDAWIAVPPEHAPSAAARAPLTDRLANDGYW
jgi:hypothetical protein